MILIKQFKKKIPSFRWKKIINIFDNSFTYKKKNKKIKNLNLIKRKKQLNINNNSLIINKFLLTNYIFITKNYSYNFKPYKKYIACSTLSNFTIIIPGIEKLNVGKIIFNYSLFDCHKYSVNFKGFFCYLKNIPITYIFSNVTGVLSKNIIYSKASGTYCKTRKAKKNKNKLILVILPSNQEIYLNKNNKAYVGKNTNYTIKKLVENKYGFSFYKKKIIKVRGVAMNPVDHPNGGRAKTVQPEKSPWNWIAKHKK